MGSSELDKPKSDFKGQMANGKIQMVYHLPFALCRLPFEVALRVS
jgi:hypothetical protein